MVSRRLLSDAAPRPAWEHATALVSDADSDVSSVWVKVTSSIALEMQVRDTEPRQQGQWNPSGCGRPCVAKQRPCLVFTVYIFDGPAEGQKANSYVINGI